MKSPIRPTAINEVSHRVVLLHKVLDVLGLPVLREEVEQKKAGPDTRKKVRTLQKELNVPIDESTLVNQTTVAAVSEVLEQRGFIDASRAFTVTGTVRLPDGSVKKRQLLLAFDIDLRGAAIYRDVKTLAEIEKHGGFEFLGEAVSDALGNYRITFYDWQYRRAERGKADVVVYAVEEGKGRARISGQSDLVHSEDYSEKGLVRGLDVMVTPTETRSEYEALMRRLDTFLKESDTTLREIAASADQLDFAASELDIDITHLTIGADAALLIRPEDKRLSHELLYGIGRQNIRLAWTVLYKKTSDELRAAITKSVEQHIIHPIGKQRVTAFLNALAEAAGKSVLDDKHTAGGHTLNTLLSHALPKETQRAAFMNAIGTFNGSDFREFWSKHLPAQPAFEDKPQLIEKVLLAQQVTMLTGNHQPLVGELLDQRSTGSTQDLFGLEDSDWQDIIKKTGVPGFIQGQSDDDKVRAYSEFIQSTLNVAFPTQRIAVMLQKDQLPIEKTNTASKIATFLSANKNFDFARSSVHEFKKEIQDAAGDDFDEVRSELKKIQRVFQVSTSPEAMTALLKNNLHSAYTISNIPRKAFIQTYADALGGENTAFAIHQRASHIATKTEISAMHIMEYSHALTPQCIMGESEYNAAMATIESHLPNSTPTFAALFGSPDICECEQCRSVYSAAAYFVDLLRFLWRCNPNSDGKTPLDMLKARRPDLLSLPLTCENTKTIIPYLDLANEVMEYYAAHDSLANFQGYDTGDAMAEELRANPQNFDLEAYRKLKDAKYPFTLPYHQPLDVIRTYSNYLNVSRYQAMKAVNPHPDATIANAIAAECLRLSPEEYRVLTGKDFDGTADTTPLYQYFGYSGANELEQMSAVPEFLQRSGINYTDLVELVKTQFINPYQGTLDFLQQIFAYASTSASTIYNKLKQIAAGTLSPASDADIAATLTAYNTAQATSITPIAFGQWVTAHFGEFQQVLTLYEPNSKCDLTNTKLYSVKSIYESAVSSGVTEVTWSKIHRFIRLWKKLGWSIHETDLMLAALGQSDIKKDTIGSLEAVSLLQTATKQPLNQLAVLWGMIDTCGDKSLYKKLFLNKAVQQIDPAFKADSWGNYLQDGTEVLADHQSALLAAFRIREEDLRAILDVAKVIDGGNPRPIDPSTDALNLANLSTIYRYAVLAKVLKLRVTELCKLIALFGASPCSTFDIQQKKFTNVAPEKTYAFYELATSIKRTGFKASVLEYIFQGMLPADSKIGLDRAKTLQTAKAIRDAFSAIGQAHSDTPPSPLTADVIASKLALTFAPDIVSRFMGILDGTAAFETTTDANLNLTIPSTLTERYTYVKGSGRLTCVGVVADNDQLMLKGLAGASNNFKDAIDKLYSAPADFISTNFGGVFSNLPQTYATLLDHPTQGTPASLEDKYKYVYQHFVPLLKSKLRHDAITQHIAALIHLSDEATALLIAPDVESLVTNLSTKGFSGTYYSNATWTPPAALPRTDDTINFDWAMAAPDPAVPADNFSVKWESYISPPASATYTFVVDVDGADESFRLYLDDTLILEKASGDATTSWEIEKTLNASQMYLLRLEYAEVTQRARVRLQWKTTTSASDVVPAAVAYPAAILDDFANLVTIYHRAGKFISGFALSETELNHLLSFKADFGNIDFKALTAAHWQRIADYVALRNAVPQAQAFLTDVFALANKSKPPPSVADTKPLLYQATAWDRTSVAFLIDTYFALGVADFKSEIAFNRIRAVMDIVASTGLSAQAIAEWGRVEIDFDKLHATAQLIKNTVKSKYEEEDWLNLASGLSDKIRENEKQALIGYLLTRPAIQAWGAKDADGLFEYFLIDVQMGACMDTSRIVQANASVQMFVNRCLLNLESNKSSGVEKGVPPSAIDKDRFEWMKNYRVWEANRKIFLYPENWLEPDWRNDRSEFFKELESYLVQNDITDRSVEQAFRNYLASLNEVANPDVCGLHQEKYDDGSFKCLHVFARTHSAPYKYFYRTWNQYRKWSAWQKVPVDIRSVEDLQDGNNSGVHVVPVVWKKRLFLFWPEFREMQEAPDTGNDSAEQAAKKQMSTLAAIKYWQVQLAWSEYVDNKWTPKQVSKEYVTIYPGNNLEKDLLLTPYIEADTQKLNTFLLEIFYRKIKGSQTKIKHKRFILSDIQSPITTGKEVKNSGSADKYNVRFEKRQWNGPLALSDNTYLQNSTDHDLLPIDTTPDVDITPEAPFFFSDLYRTYFVRPVDTSWLEWIRNPDWYEPFIPTFIDPRKYRFQPSFPIPHEGPDDYMPIRRDAPAFMGAATGHPLASSREEGPMLLAQPMMLSSTGGPLAITAEPSALSKSYATEWSSTAKAFGGARAPVYEMWTSTIVHRGTGLEFHTFYHPYSSVYVKNLNQSDIAGLMESDTTLPSDNGTSFESTYNPNFLHGFVQKPADFSTRTYYKENVCFDVYGANNLYNWELFFHAPLYIATRLSKNGRFEEAMKWFHYIFDPTTDATPGPGESEVSRYWKVLPFKTTPAQSLEDWFRGLAPNTDPNTENAVIGEWRDHPFDAHLVASNRPLAYMKHVVMKYVENLIAWGDFLFRQDTMESVNEALQIYVIANHILGPRPQFVPKRGEIKAESYKSLENKWDDFSNALVELENIFPYSSEAPVSNPSPGTNLLGVGSALYFCVPPNDKLLEHWDTAADRLFKIRHCQNIEGIERKLALFAPPIEPGALIQAASQGLSLGSILADLSSPPPIYRFMYLIQKANEFCADIKALGNALLAALEKKDAEELSRLRASHETQMLELMTGIKERQLLDAKASKENLLKARATASFRLQHYLGLIGNTSVSISTAPSVSADLTADSALPADTALATVQTGVDDSLVDSDESGVKVIPKEKEGLDKNLAAKWFNVGAGAGETLAGVFHLVPQLDAEGTPLGVGAGAWWGGQNLGAATEALARAASTVAKFLSEEAAQAVTVASYIRREQDWTLQANLAAKEIIQLDKQITSADIRIQIAKKELDNHTQQIENSKAIESFLQDKFTNQELYQWMKEQLFAVYRQAYNLVYDMAKKAEKAYKYETGVETASFIQYGYWDNSKQGLVAGEYLQLALRQLEKSYIEENRRELEVTKSVSLARLNPLALIQLRETGKCYVSLPEELFDLDFRGHYFRCIKGVRLSIPCIAGPYTSVSCSLRLLNNTMRINTAMNGQGNYEHENDDGIWIDDDRFRSNHIPVTAIATSTGQSDSGMFEFNFRDERYLPFERAGAISEWEIELSTAKDQQGNDKPFLPQFDYSTISDVILHLNYTAREQGGIFKDKATNYIKDFIANVADLTEQPLAQMFSLKHEFPTEWYKFLHPAAVGAEQIMNFTVGRERLPFFVQDRNIVIEKIELFAKCTEASTYNAILSYVNQDGDTVTSAEISLPQNSAYGGLNKATLNATDAGLILEELDIAKSFNLELKRSTAVDYTKLMTNPDEVQDIIVVLHYKLS
jgi:hypothetical protein